MKVYRLIVLLTIFYIYLQFNMATLCFLLYWNNMTSSHQLYTIRAFFRSDTLEWNIAIWPLLESKVHMINVRAWWRLNWLVKKNPWKCLLHHLVWRHSDNDFQMWLTKGNLSPQHLLVNYSLSLLLQWTPMANFKSWDQLFSVTWNVSLTTASTEKKNFSSDQIKTLSIVHCFTNFFPSAKPFLLGAIWELKSLTLIWFYP